MSYKVAIVGRPNVGKSTLFNRLAGKQLAIVDDQPGVTRDRREAEAELAGIPLMLIDTAGFEDVKDASLEARMRTQTEKAIAHSDVIFFVYDARVGLTPLDEEFAALVRSQNRKVILLANKAENSRAAQDGISEGYALGLGTPVPFSAEHGEGLADLIERMIELFPEKERASSQVGQEIPDDDESLQSEEDSLAPLRLAIVGRPNVGKSTLINAIIGEERLLTGPEAGITRDAIEIPYEYNEQPFYLVDTAGMRKKSKVQNRIEKMSVEDTLKTIQYANAVVLLVDATEGLEKQDFQIAGHVVEEGRILIVALNKWDLVDAPKDVIEEMRYRLGRSLAQIKGVPLVPVSALEKKGFDMLLETVFAHYHLWNRRIQTSRLNDWLEEVVSAHPPPMVRGRRLKIRYMTQIKVRPPTFAVFVNRPKELPEDYKRYLKNQLAEDFELEGVTIRFVFRGGKNPYVEK